MPTCRFINECDITPALDTALIELLCHANPDERAIFITHGRGWHGVHPAFCTIIEYNNQPVAYVGIVDRTIRVDPAASGIGVPPMFLRIAGPQNVSVHPNHRGQGLSLIALNRAMQHAAQQNFDAGLLFCTPNLERLYSKAHWQTLPATTITRIENGAALPLPEHNIPMFLPLRLKTFPPGPIHLQGNDW
jgi:GNAT superfamily N-acetyltransferase